MKQRFIDDLQKTANTIQNACAKLSQLNELRQKFHGGETLKLTLKIGEEEITETLLNANGKALPLAELFAMLEAAPRKALAETACDLQTILEVESAE